eukprot:CAMPEP_0180382868 /NCGR_PEP_ID=MMETSP0989-20121125/27606_1 /TAXON_ID=697907 /ORGANISM="non described non described, Strain CCMP2293" /LENGTH=55 /DNA_ID=CAMNT_0022383035 /DNA_START=103 /DNA_END=267 /DNA_ORIENTATION=+
MPGTAAGAEAEEALDQSHLSDVSGMNNSMSLQEIDRIIGSLISSYSPSGESPQAG